MVMTPNQRSLLFQAIALDEVRLGQLKFSIKIHNSADQEYVIYQSSESPFYDGGLDYCIYYYISE